MKKYYKILAVLIIIFIPHLALQNGPENGDDIQHNPNLPVLRKPMSFADEAVGVMDKGQLQNLTMNFGQVTDTRYEDVGNAPTQYFFDFRYPRRNYTGLCDDFSIFFALPENSMNGNNGNVIDGWTDNDNEDWIAKDGSYGKTHYNPATDPNPHAALLYPPDNPTTPYLAHSDLQVTWPVDETGVSFWPGYFRRDPDTGEEIEGEFASDRDVYAVFDDSHNQLGNVIGLEVEMMAYCYGRPYADKFQFYEFFIHNKSGRRLDSCYVGYYSDPDCSDYGEEIFILPDPTFSDPDLPDALINRDFDGDIGGATSPTSLGTFEDYSFGVGFLETPQDMGITDFHYFTDPGPTSDIILWPIVSSQPTDPDISSFADLYFHGADRRIDDVNLLTEKSDLAFIIATGPFSMEPDEVVKSTIAVLVGETDADFMKQLAQAQQMYDFKFVGPSAPPAPKLSAVPGDGKVTLYWGSTPESSPDPFTSDIDFEGYRIYRSEDNGQTWGREVIDVQGNLIGYVPLTYFDLNNGISGFDPRNPAVYLGDDTGLKHSFVDETAKNGIKYSYTIVSYDRGDSIIYSLESARGTSTADQNFVSITPTPAYLGKIPAQVEYLTHIEGTGKGDIHLEVIDDRNLPTDVYEVRFIGRPATAFNLQNLTTGEVLLQNSPINYEDTPIAEGFQMSVSSEQKIGGVKSITDGYGKDVYGEGKSDSSGSWFVSLSVFPSGAPEYRIRDYEFRFTEEGAIAYSWGPPTTSTAAFPVGFDVWDVTDPQNPEQLIFQVKDDNSNQQWEEGETIFLIREPYPNPNIGDPLVTNFPSTFVYQVSILNASADTLRVPPQTGDRILIESYRSITDEDVYQFKFKPTYFDQAQVDLSEIRVVPNPYLVGAAWEELQNVHQVRFMFLPPECTINIYTLSGEKVNSIVRRNYQTGDELFNLVNFSNQAMAFGVYVYVVSTPDGKTHTGKFAIIR
ncbi:MAG: hypothetical protein EH225_03030 [Calditrichaeota bacterium]|nr:hypothetical protein [Calditrichota bacterium]RQW06617.1 MAG: hypothetical protein EH225_03030 [Calditrichota bacterium]